MRKLLIVAAAAVGVGAVAWLLAGEVEPAARTWSRRLSEKDVAALPQPFRALVGLHEPLAPPLPGEWLDQHAERGETYRQFVAGRPVRATKARRTIYLQPLGEFTEKEREIVRLTGEFLARFFQLPAKVEGELALDGVPAEAERKNPYTGQRQVLTGYVLNEVMKPRLPDDAAAAIALSAEDLWPGEGWNFVFGQASLSDRVGVWSLQRFGDAGAGEEEFRLALRRTLKVAAHETGHMFSIPHCVYFDCVMNGSNHLEESDSRPLWLCPQCLAKLCYATGADPGRRFRQLAEFAEEQGLDAERAFWERSLETLEAAGGAAGGR